MKLKELRIARKLTQRDMAKILGIGKSTYSYWENGTFEPDLATLTKLADFFDVSVDYLLGRSNNCNAFDKSKIEQCLSDFPYNISEYDSLNINGKKKVDDYISDLAASGLYKKDAPKAPKRDVYDLSKQYPLGARHAKQYAAAHGDDSNLEEARRLFEEAIDKDDDL